MWVLHLSTAKPEGRDAITERQGRSKGLVSCLSTLSFHVSDLMHSVSKKSTSEAAEVPLLGI